DELQAIMDYHCNIVREGKELAEGIAKLQPLKARAKNVKALGASQYNPGWHEALSIHSLLITAEAVSRAALLRRGALARGADARGVARRSHARRLPGRERRVTQVPHRDQARSGRRDAGREGN